MIICKISYNHGGHENRLQQSQTAPCYVCLKSKHIPLLFYTLPPSLIQLFTHSLIHLFTHSLIQLQLIKH